MEFFGGYLKRGRTAFFIKLFIFLALMTIYYFKVEWIDDLGIEMHHIQALMIFLGFNLVITFSRIIVSRFYIKRVRRQNFEKDNFLFGLTRIASIINVVVFIAALFLFFQIDFKEVFTSLSIIAAAIAILSKDYFSNMINGMIIMFTDQISLGDFIQVGNHRGTVKDITFINIHIMDENDDLVYFPNSLFFSTEVVNFSKRDLNKVNIYFVMDIQHLEYVEVLEEQLKEHVSSFNELIIPGSTYLRTVSVKKDQVEFSFQYIIKEHDKENEKEIRKTVMRSLVRYLKRT